MTLYDVVLVPFPFSDLTTSKKRPGLVLCAFTPRGLREHCIVSMMTSNLSGLQFPGDVALKLWREISLPKPTMVRLSKLVTLDSQLIIKKIARLKKSDQQAVSSGLKALFREIL